MMCYDSTHGLVSHIVLLVMAEPQTTVHPEPRQQSIAVASSGQGGGRGGAAPKAARRAHPRPLPQCACAPTRVPSEPCSSIVKYTANKDSKHCLKKEQYRKSREAQRQQDAQQAQARRGASRRARAGGGAAAAATGFARGAGAHEKPGASLLAPRPNPVVGETTVAALTGAGDGEAGAGAAVAGCQLGARRDWLAWSSSLGTVEEMVTGAAACVMMRATSATVARGYACSTRAATPAAWGAAMEVPLMMAVEESLAMPAEVMEEPGATMSTQEPTLEKDDRASFCRREEGRGHGAVQWVRCVGDRHDRPSGRPGVPFSRVAAPSEVRRGPGAWP